MCFLSASLPLRDIPGFMTTSGGIRRKVFFQGKFHIVVDAIVNKPSLKAACLNRKMKSSNLKQNKMKTGNNRISLKLPQDSSERRNPFQKEWGEAKRCCSGTASHAGGCCWNNAGRRKRTGKWLSVCRRWDSARTKHSGTGGKSGEANKTAATKREKLSLSFLQPPSKTKDLIQGNPYSHAMHKEGTGTPRVVPKRKRLGKIQAWSQKEVVDMGMLFAQKYFKWCSKFNDKVDFTLSSGFSGFGLIPIGGIRLFPIWPFSSWMLRAAWYRLILEG